MAFNHRGLFEVLTYSRRGGSDVVVRLGAILRAVLVSLCRWRVRLALKIIVVEIRWIVSIFVLGRYVLGRTSTVRVASRFVFLYLLPLMLEFLVLQHTITGTQRRLWTQAYILLIMLWISLLWQFFLFHCSAHLLRFANLVPILAWLAWLCVRLRIQRMFFS